MILVHGCSFTAGEESTVAWPSLLPHDTVNLAQPGVSNDYIVRSTVEYLNADEQLDISHVIIAWTTPNRIELSGKHLTPTSGRKYGAQVDAVFADWDEDWAYRKFISQVEMMDSFLFHCDIPHIFVSTFDIQTRAQFTDLGHFANDRYLGWPNKGIVEWMGDCPKGPGGHPLELGHQRIAEKINEHIRNLGWLPRR